MVPALRFTREFRGPVEPLFDALRLAFKSVSTGRSGVLIVKEPDSCTWALINPGEFLPSWLLALGELTWLSTHFTPQFWISRPRSRQGKSVEIGGTVLRSFEDLPFEQLCRQSVPFHLLIQSASIPAPNSREQLLVSLELTTDSREVADVLVRWLGGYVSTTNIATLAYDSEIAFYLRPPISTPTFNSEGILKPAQDLLSLLQTEPEQLDSHCLIAGQVGSGKSNSVMLVLDRAIKAKDLQGLCVVDIKGEYEAWARKHGVEYLAIGEDLHLIKRLRVNLFKPAGRQRLDAHIENLALLFTVGEFGGAPTLLPSYMRFVVRDFYKRLWGRDGTEFERVCAMTGAQLAKEGAWFSPKDKQETMIDYFYRYWQEHGGRAFSEWTRGFRGGDSATVAAMLSVRIESIKQSPLLRNFDYSASAGGIDALLDRKIVISLRDLAMNEIQFVMFLLALFYGAAIQLQPDAPKRMLRNLFVLEEAHRVLERPKGESQEFNTAQAYLARLWTIALREFRSRGFGIVISDQSPSSLIDAVLEANTKIIHRMPNPTDQEQLTKSLALPAYASLATLGLGECWATHEASHIRQYQMPKWSPD